MRDDRIGLSDGRELAYTDIGEPSWPCVVLCHGAPASRLRVAYLEADFLARRVRVVSPDRPSYGGSSPQPGRSMADWPRDVEALTDALGIDRFVAAGHSSGGPYALACAALLGARVQAAIVLSGVTDMGWDGAWEGYFEAEKQLMRSADEQAAVELCVKLFGEDGSGFMSASGLSFAPPDERLYEDEVIAGLLSIARAEAFRQGVAGYAQDMVVQGQAWPFDPTSIAVPVHVVHAGSDTVVPVAHSVHTSELVPGAELSVLPDHGHFSLLGELPSLASRVVGNSGPA